MKPLRRQEGLTLLIALVMLVVITLFVVSMIKLGGTSASIVGNMQAQKAITAEAQQAVELALNSGAFIDHLINAVDHPTAPFASPTTEYISYASLWANYKAAGATTMPPMQATDIKIYRPQCIHFQLAKGESALNPSGAPRETYWDLRVDATDSFTQATTEIHQGVKILLLADCP